MPRKQNYGFDKRRKEQDRKAKKDAKLLDKQRRREQEAAENRVTSDTDGIDATQPSSLPADEDR